MAEENERWKKGELDRTALPPGRDERGTAIAK
jgi:hypothetical protein